MTEKNKKAIEEIKEYLRPNKSAGHVILKDWEVDELEKLLEKAINNSREELLGEFSEDLRFLNISGDQHMEIQRLIKKYKSPTADKEK